MKFFPIPNTKLQTNATYNIPMHEQMEDFQREIALERSVENNY